MLDINTAASDPTIAAATSYESTGLNNDGDADFDTNIDDLIDEDSFAADIDPNPTRVRSNARDQIVAEDDGNEDMSASDSEMGEEEEDKDHDEEEMEAAAEDLEMQLQSDAAEYHAAMVEKVKVYDDDDESDDEYVN